MVLSRVFTQAKDHDYEHIAAASGRLRALLEAFAEDRLPPDYGMAELEIYARSLMETQRPDGSFAACADPQQLDEDTRTDAHRFVTWSAAAFLCRIQDAGAGGFKGAVSRVLNTPLISDFAFPASGPAEIIQQTEAVMILAAGNIPSRLKNDPEQSPALNTALKGLKQDFDDCLKSGASILPGDISYEPWIRQAQSALSV